MAKSGRRRQRTGINWEKIILGLIALAVAVTTGYTAHRTGATATAVETVGIKVEEVRKDVNSSASALAAIAKEKDARLERLEKDLATAKARAATLEERTAERAVPATKR